MSAPAGEGTAVTDTPIYDQVRDDLSARRRSTEHTSTHTTTRTSVPSQPVTAPVPQSTGKRTAESGDGSSVSVWALVDQHRSKGGRRARP